jgi:lambda family phage portal protein
MPSVSVKSTNNLIPNARFDSAAQGRRTRGWVPPSSGPNSAMQGIQTTVNRSRDAFRNDPIAASAIQKWATTLIGVGITPRFNRIKAKSRKAVIRDLYSDFVEFADADGVLNSYGQQTLAVLSLGMSGEVFARKRVRPITSRFNIPLQIQLIESDQCPKFDADIWPGLPAGNRIRQGIELTRSDRKVAAWMYRNHPGENSTSLASIGIDLLERVPMEQLIHMFEPKRPGQLRGIPELSPVLTSIRTMGDYRDATLDRQRLANLFVAFITREMQLGGPGGNEDALDGVDHGTDDAGNALAPLAPGIIQELGEGEKVEFSNPPEAGTTYSDYIRTETMSHAAGVNMPYELLSGDILNISDRTLRVIINEFRRFAEQRQWQTVIPMFCQPIMNWFAEACLLAGHISLNEFENVRRVEHSTHGWAHIHPVQDPQGKKLEVDAGFKARQQIISGNGDDPDDVDDMRKQDEDREANLKVKSAIAPTGKVQPNAQQATKPADQSENQDEDQ